MAWVRANIHAVGLCAGWRRLRRIAGFAGSGVRPASPVEQTSSSIQQIIRLGRASVEKKTLRALDRCVRRLAGEIRSDARSIVITGYPRIGKTVTAKELAARHGFLHFELDRLRPVYFGIDEPALRQVARSHFLHRLLEKFPRGLILEGDDLISANRFDDSHLRPLSLDTLTALHSAHGVSCYVLGNKDADADARAAAMREFQQTQDCWTARESGWEDLDDRARDSIGASQELYAMASGTPVVYLEINPTDFAASVSRAADRIWSEVKKNTPPTVSRRGWEL
jgi:predicted kinase